MNRIKSLEKALLAERKEHKAKEDFSNETIRKLQEQCSRMSKWASEIEASAQDRLEEKDARIKNLERAMSRMAEEIYGL
jgi:hypothetical protein